MLQDFKDFISRGNVLELAVAVIIGAAFGKIVTSLVDKIISPFIGYFMGGQDFSKLKYVISEATMAADGTVQAAEVAIGWGAFLQAITDFLIVALVVFLVVRAYMKTQKPVEEAPAGPSEVELLTEIRDSLRK